MRQGNGKALVLATGAALEYRTLRCAAACFDAVHVLGTVEARLLRFSRSCASFTPAGTTAEHFATLDVGVVNELCRRLDIATVLPSDGASTRWIAANRDKIAVACFPVPSAETFDILDDKHSFGMLCAELGIPVPPTVLLPDKGRLAAELEQGTVGLPAVVKPLRMWGSFGVAKLDRENKDAVLAAIDYAPVLVQDYIAGRDLSAFYLCEGGVPRAAAIYHKTRSEVHFFRHERITALARKVIEHFKYDGVIGFDIRERPDGALFFLECNPRFWYNLDAASRAGLNFVALGMERGKNRAMLELDEVRVARPKALLQQAPWKFGAAHRRLAGELLGDAAVIALMYAQLRLGAASRARGQAL